ncbi:hypothetical protein [uncultured Campylobacter sp.]|uniref:hypothetical protein n=1 Tax=uncultured Campylobacter sp. TaxID=218934 RepID=UPI00260B507B|nr:hypothetical protein [uncultured Campylobacter sp.]
MKDKEKLGIYNVTFNDKRATPVTLNPDIALVENAVIDTVVMYVKGWHNIKRDKGIGAEHLKYHLKQGAIGEVSLEELLNLGRSLRKYMKIFGEPFLEDKTKTGKVFEWQDSDGIRFRVTMDSKRQAGEEGLITPLSLPNKTIITFYSDRNLNARMVFKNPAVREFYESKKLDDVEDYSAVEEIKAEISKSSIEKIDVDTNKNSKRRNGNGS